MNKILFPTFILSFNAQYIKSTGKNINDELFLINENILNIMCVSFDACLQKWTISCYNNKMQYINLVNSALNNLVPTYSAHEGKNEVQSLLRYRVKYHKTLATYILLTNTIIILKISFVRNESLFKHRKHVAIY